MDIDENKDWMEQIRALIPYPVIENGEGTIHYYSSLPKFDDMKTKAKAFDVIIELLKQLYEPLKSLGKFEENIRLILENYKK